MSRRGRLTDMGLSSEDYKQFRNPIDFYIKSIAMTLLLPDSVTSGRRLCSTSLAHSLEQLFHHGWKLDDFLKHCPIFVDALMLCAISMTDDKLRDLEQRLSSCHCHSFFPKPTKGSPYVDMQALHVDLPVDSMLQVCGRLFRHLFAFLFLPTRAPAKTKEKVANGQRVVPDEFKTIVRYMTNKAADVLAACCCWQRRYKSRDVTVYMALCLDRWPKAFKPVFRSEKGQEMLSVSASELERIVNEVQGGTSTITDYVANGIRIHAEFIYKFVVWFPSGFQHRCGPLVYEITYRFQDMLRGLPAAERTLLDSRGISDKVCQLTGFTLPLPLPADFPFVQMHTKMQENMAENGGVVGEVLRAHKGQHGIYFLVWMDLVSAILAVDSECLNPNCAKLPEQHRFPKCARCNIVAYCSKECQAEAWTLPRCPHKELCKEWTRLRRCWPDVWETMNDGLCAEERDELLKKLSSPLGISESRMNGLHDNYQTLHDMRIERYTAIVYGDAVESTTSQEQI